MATSDLERFFGYMQAFEMAWLSDDWSGLGDAARDERANGKRQLINSVFVAGFQSVPKCDNPVKQVHARHRSDDASAVTIDEVDPSRTFKDSCCAMSGIAEF